MPTSGGHPPRQISRAGVSLSKAARSRPSLKARAWLSPQISTFGGPSGPKAGNQAPDRKPDGVVETPTLPQQALLYRLCGDKNPLHADPEFAKMGGFDKPIIHGLCSYGINCKAAVDAALGGDVDKVARYEARFRGVFFPGETMVTKLWNEGDNRFSFEALPLLAQLSPTYGAAAADYDLDGHLDVFLSQNFYSAQPETGFMAGGL